jgi:hypothetical protein
VDGVVDGGVDGVVDGGGSPPPPTKPFRSSRASRESTDDRDEAARRRAVRFAFSSGIQPLVHDLSTHLFRTRSRIFRVHLHLAFPPLSCGFGHGRRRGLATV